MKYFAYGSNMSFLRLKARVADAERIGVYALAEHSLRFHKVSKDGSGKCDAFFTGSQKDFVLGALFDLSESDKAVLDKVEGLGFGYQDKTVQVCDSQGNYIEAIMYCATKIDSSLPPYSWYVYHVVFGAKEIDIPKSYLDAIEAISSITDPNRERDVTERSIYEQK